MVAVRLGCYRWPLQASSTEIQLRPPAGNFRGFARSIHRLFHAVGHGNALGGRTFD